MAPKALSTPKSGSADSQRGKKAATKKKAKAKVKTKGAPASEAGPSADGLGLTAEEEDVEAVMEAQTEVEAEVEVEAQTEEDVEVVMKAHTEAIEATRVIQETMHSVRQARFLVEQQSSRPDALGVAASPPMTPPVKRAALVVIDGWGEREEEYGNAILQASTPVMDGLKAGTNFAIIEASGLAVGLPEGTMGNSEVGHLTIGAGAVDYQDLVRINLSVRDGNLPLQPNLLAALQAAKDGTGRLHLFGLLSDGGVHSHQDHLYAILQAAKDAGVPRTLLHLCTDGRDTPPTSGAAFMELLEAQLMAMNYGEISTISGRYYAMDRDKRWERVKQAYDVMCRPPEPREPVTPDGVKAPGGVKALLEAKYAMDENDEFIKPTPLSSDGGIADGDVFFCFNFRADRAREMFECMSISPKFETEVARKPAMCLQMTQYSSSFKSPIVFAPNQQSDGLCETVAKLGLSQFHVAETEKYAHVTFFFNGGREAPFEGEVRELMESPKVATYDQAPKMAAEPVADAMVREIAAGQHALLICNLAPPDMVGHTGMMDKAMEAAAHTDFCVGKISTACEEAGVGLFILADHGNCETMLTQDGKPVTSHSTSNVPFIAMLPPASSFKFNRDGGGCADVAPTMLTYMGIEVPEAMSGKSFI